MHAKHSDPVIHGLTDDLETANEMMAALGETVEDMRAVMLAQGAHIQQLRERVRRLENPSAGLAFEAIQ